MAFWLYTLSLLPLVNAWTFLYTNATGNATILHDTGPDNCTQIDLAGGKLFSWDPEDSGLCISIYYDASCKDRGGLSCNAWSKNASTNFHGVQIYSETDSSSASVSTSSPTPTASTSTSTLSSTSTSTTSSTSTSLTPTSKATPISATAASGGSPSSLSSGAIAGIVIGVLAGVVIIGGLFFYFGRRNRNVQAANSISGPTSGPMSGSVSGSVSGHPHGPYSPESSMLVAGYARPSYGDSSDKAPNSSSGMSSVRPAPGSRVVELAGHEQAVELGNSPISELDGQQSEKFSYRV